MANPRVQLGCIWSRLRAAAGAKLLIATKGSGKADFGAKSVEWGVEATKWQVLKVP